METNQYIEIFLDESQEHLQAINDNLLKLEKAPTELPLVNEIFRSAHTLKGMAATMGYEDIASLTHKMENVLDLIRQEKLTVTTAVIDITFAAIESLEEMVSDISQGGDGKKDVSALVIQLEKMEQGETTSQDQTTGPSELKLEEQEKEIFSQIISQGLNLYQITVRLTKECQLKAARVYMIFEALKEVGEIIKATPSVEELEQEQFEQEFSLVLPTDKELATVKNKVAAVSEVEQVEVVAIQAKDLTHEQPNTRAEQQENASESRQSQQKEKQASSQKGKQSKTIRVNTDRIDKLMNVFEQLVIERGRLDDMSRQLHDKDLTSTVEHMTRVSKDMQEMMLAMRMVPIEQVFNRFPRMVRGLAKDLHKEINLEITGADTELDRKVVDELGDSLVHLIRNSVDHGIESPEERKQQGKDGAGTLSLRAFHSGNHVFIEIEDDGGGINKEKVMEKAVQKGLVSEEKIKDFTNEEVYDLIFASGFSTADQVSDISGRGVGLDAVRNKIESLGGNIRVDSNPGQGSIFSIQLPLTLSILSVLLVRVGSQIYTIPLTSIEETLLLTKDNFIDHETMMYRGATIPYVSLGETFGLKDYKGISANIDTAVVMVRQGDSMVGLVVDEFIGQREVVLKSLGELLQHVHAISGATILGDGNVSLIIDPNAFIDKSA